MFIDVFAKVFQTNYNNDHCNPKTGAVCKQRKFLKL